MSAPTFMPDDYDPIAQRVSLGDVGQPDYCTAEVIGPDGGEVFMLCRCNLGDGADYVTDWARVAPHEMVNGLPVYRKD